MKPNQAARMEQASANTMAVALLKEGRINREIGKQIMQKSVLEWAIANADKLQEAEIMTSLLWVLTSSKDEGA